MKRTQLLSLALALLISGFTETYAQQPARYLVRFSNKNTSPFSLANAGAYLSTRSIARRTAYGLALDSTDLPVTPRYIDSLRSVPTVVVLNTSKWLNQVSIRLTDTSAANVSAVLNKINSFSFVRSSQPTGARGTEQAGKFEETTSPLQQRGQGVLADVYNYGASTNQVRMHNGQFLHNIGLRGQGKIIGVLDAGFLNYLTVKAFDSARANGQILGTWDFVANEASVNEDNSHGMQCFSVMAANIPGQFVGTAPKASYYLFRSEDAVTEYPIEEHNWVCAAERVDSAGGDMISSSLGYNIFDAPLASQSHTFAQLNGNTTMAAIGADLAAKKGILVVNSAGNEGNSSWGRIMTPADGDSVLAVGAVNASGVAASFTSRGPSADGQVKPDVASQGVATVVQGANNTIVTSNGTSFAAPNIAGLAACLWQGFPEYNNMKIINALRQAGSRATNPNDSVGYGIPDVRKALVNLLKEFTTFTATTTNCNTTLSISTKAMKDMKFELERQLPGASGFTRIAESFGTGATFANASLQLTDSLFNVQPGTITYRVRLVADTTATNTYADYLDTATTSIAAACRLTTGINTVDPNATTVVIAPNPARDVVNVKLTTAASIRNLQLRIVDGKGRTIKLMNTQAPAGISTHSIPVSTLASGKYYLSLFNGSKLLFTSEWIKL